MDQSCVICVPSHKIVSSSPNETKAQILIVAERLFAERGFAGTTLRNIVSEAQVNLAAVHYHFGSKEELFRAVVQQFAQPVVERELVLLAELKTQIALPSLEAILTAMVQPSLEILAQDQEMLLVRSQFMGRCRTEPEPIQTIAYQEFAKATEAFLDVLQQVLPEQSRAQLAWKLDLVITVMVRVLMEAGKPHALLKSNRPKDIQATTDALVRFLSPGMRS